MKTIRMLKTEIIKIKQIILSIVSATVVVFVTIKRCIHIYEQNVLSSKDLGLNV